MPASTSSSGVAPRIRPTEPTSAHATPANAKAASGIAHASGSGSAAPARIARAAPKPAPAEMPSV